MAQLSYDPNEIIVEVSSVKSFINQIKNEIKQIPDPGVYVIETNGVLTGTVSYKGSNVEAVFNVGDKISYSVTPKDIVAIADEEFHTIKPSQFISVVEAGEIPMD